MDLTQLRTFVAVAEERHLTRAAERLHISQPAASAHIRALEETLGLALFERSNRGLELTPAGHALVKHAKRLLDEALHLLAEARGLRGSPSGPLRLGSNADPELSRVAAVVERVRGACPLITLSIQTRSSASTLQGIRNGELDVGFVLGEPPAGGVAALTLRTVRYRVAGPAAWEDRLARADLATLAQLPWVTTETGNSYARMIDQLFGARGLEVNSVVQANHADIIRALIGAGVGVCLVREDQALEARAAGRLSVSERVIAETALMFVYPDNRRTDPLLRAFDQAVRQVWRID